MPKDIVYLKDIELITFYKNSFKSSDKTHLKLLRCNKTWCVAEIYLKLKEASLERQRLLKTHRRVIKDTPFQGVLDLHIWRASSLPDEYVKLTPKVLAGETSKCLQELKEKSQKDEWLLSSIEPKIEEKRLLRKFCKSILIFY